MRQNAKAYGLLPVSHDLFATPRPFSNNPDAPPAEIIPTEEWTGGMRTIVDYSKFLGKELLNRNIMVQIVKELGAGCRAAYGHGTLYFSLRGLGRKWFDNITEDVEALLIHEFAHEYAPNHLSEDYHKALCKLAVRFKRLALEKPDELKKYLGY
jgi:hypothetical protein